MTGIHTSTSQSIVFSEIVNQANLETVIGGYYRDIRKLFLETFGSIFEEYAEPPEIVFYDYEIDQLIQGQKNIHIYYDRITNEIRISRDILGNIGLRENNNITTALGLYLLIAHEFGHAFEELGNLSMTQEEQEAFADSFSGYMFRSVHMIQQLDTKIILEAIIVFDNLGLLCREMEEYHGTKNIHGDEKIRVKNFLTGYMMTPQKFASYVAQFAEIKEQIKTIKSLLLSLIK